MQHDWGQTLHNRNGAFGVLTMADVVPLNAPKASATKDLYDIGEIPPLGVVPAKMHAWAIRKERHGPPVTSMQLEVVPTWPIGEDKKSIAARVTIQRVVWNTAHEITLSESVIDQAIYAEFFDKLSKSLFLTAQAL